MHVWHGCDEVRADLPATSVTVGVFDGVHRGHRALIDRVVADRDRGLLPVALTFDPHPMTVIRPEFAPLLLTSLEHRLELFAQAGLGGVLVVPFTKALAAESAERFAARVLAGTLRARRVVVGGNFRFGHRAAGDVALLAELGRELGYDVTVVDLALLARPGSSGSGTDAAISSTAIRQMIATGDVRGAGQALGRPHRVTGPVVSGDRRGRQLGYPTANIDVPPVMAVPADGVYAARVRVAGDPQQWRPAAVSIGTNPTFGGGARRVEAYVLDAQDGYDIYGRVTDLEFIDYLRPTARFDSVSGLLAQMALDVEAARRSLGLGA